MNKESMREGTRKWERTYESTSGQEQTDQDQSESSNKKNVGQSKQKRWQKEV